MTSSVVYHQIADVDEGEQVLGVDALGVGQEARFGEQPVQRDRIALGDGALRGELEIDGPCIEALEQAEVEERHTAVVEQQEVAGVRIAGELPVAVEAAEEEAEDDLADAVALGLPAPLQLLEADAVHELRDEHALARERADHAGHDDERVAVEDARQRALVLRLELVVELLDDPLADLFGDRLDVEPGRHPLEQAHDHVEVLHVGAHGRRDARVLHLDGDLAPVGQRGAVDLADRGGRDRFLIEGGEDVVDRLFEVILDHLAHLLEGDRRRGVAQLGQLELELLAVLLGHEAHVEEGHHLPELHRGALHRPQRGDDLLGRLELALGHRFLGGLLAARDVGRAGAELLYGLAGGERRDGRRAANTRGRDLLAFARHRCILGAAGRSLGPAPGRG